MAPGPEPPRPGLLLGLLGLAMLPGLLGAAAAAGSPPLPESPEVRCVSAAPSLAWLRDSEKDSEEDSEEEGRPSGALLPRGARRLERRLSNCSSAASVLLEVQVQPELLRMEEEEEEEEGSGGLPSGLLLVLLVLVEARPPAHIAWMAPDGRRLPEAASSSSGSWRFLVAGDRTFAWPPEGPLRLGLRLGLQLGLGNASLGMPGEEGLPGAAAAAAEGLLGARVELPLAALVAGSAGALGAFLGLASLLGCLLCRRTRKAHPGAPFFPVPGPPREPSSSSSSSLKARMPGPSLSLPADLRLHGLPAAESPRGPAPREEEEEEERALSEPERNLGLGQPGLGRFPMVGYIYRASSMSSDEIWL